MGTSNWQDHELKIFCEKMRDYSVDKQIDVTDNVWKACNDNYKAIYDQLKEDNNEWRWEITQLKNKWKNVLQDYYKTVKGNAGTGEIRRTMNVGSILKELVPAESPMISNATQIESTNSVDDVPMPSAKKRKLDTFEKTVIDLVAPKQKSDLEIQIEERKVAVEERRLVLQEKQTKVDLINGMKGRSPAEMKEVLAIYNEFEL